MDLSEVKNEIIRQLEAISQDENLVSDFMQDMSEMAKVSKFMTNRLRTQNISITEQEEWLDNEHERNALIYFWVSLFKEYEARHLTERNNERYCDPFQMPH